MPNGLIIPVKRILNNVVKTREEETQGHFELIIEKVNDQYHEDTYTEILGSFDVDQ